LWQCGLVDLCWWRGLQRGRCLGWLWCRGDLGGFAVVGSVCGAIGAIGVMRVNCLDRRYRKQLDAPCRVINAVTWYILVCVTKRFQQSVRLTRNHKTSKGNVVYICVCNKGIPTKCPLDVKSQDIKGHLYG
jgi:hypothetical protein